MSLTPAQQDRAWRAVKLALTHGEHCAEDVAEERARNLVTALLYPVDDLRSVVAGILLTRRHEFREFWKAVESAELAFTLARFESSFARFACLMRAGWEPDAAAALLTLHGWASGVARQEGCCA